MTADLPKSRRRRHGVARTFLLLEEAGDQTAQAGSKEGGVDSWIEWRRSESLRKGPVQSVRAGMQQEFLAKSRLTMSVPCILACLLRRSLSRDRWHSGGARRCTCLWQSGLDVSGRLAW